LGYDLIGYSFETRVVDSCILGGLVGVLAGGPRLLNSRLFGSAVAILFSAPIAVFLLWIAACLLTPDANSGLSILSAAIVLLIGLWIGAWMWLGSLHR
jgi:hypothetical protein